MAHTPLYSLHQELGAKLVDFAGYQLPLQYGGILGEHLHTRARASLFDVSHIGQALVRADKLYPHLALDLDSLPAGKQAYAQLYNERGGIVDDLMLSRDLSAPDYFYVVVNASRKLVDFELLQPERELKDYALLALQGPQAVAVCARLLGGAELERQPFMTQKLYAWEGSQLRIARSGYSGEDGLEISVEASRSIDLARALLAADEVQPAGLGARDSLRLEAGLCLYGNDIDEDTTPIEAGLKWSMHRQRLELADFVGSGPILAQIADGAQRKLVGLRLEGKAAARAGSEVYLGDKLAGKITSGGYAPSLGCAIALGYVASEHAEPGTACTLRQRGRELAASVVKKPFVTTNYYGK